MTDKKKTILEAVEKLTDTYRKEELFLGKDRERLPNKKEIINFIKDMRSIIFPGYFSVDSSASVFPEHYVAYRLNDLYDCLQEQIEIAFLYQGEEEQKAKEHAEQITERFFANVPEIQRMLLTDLQAGFDGDPAAKSKEEIIFSYPGFYAIYVYRLAHVLYLENVPFIPRIMSEYAHGYTGIDINPGATIGEYFFRMISPSLSVKISMGVPSLILNVRRISFGITTLPRSSMRRTIPVAFIYVMFLLLFFIYLISLYGYYMEKQENYVL